jgi:hypothetical protein
MGLLDDAIRDHLELKRRRGADPAEVALEQHEALDPTPERTQAGELESSEDVSLGGTLPEDGTVSVVTAEEPVDPAEGDRPSSLQAGETVAAGEASGMEETAELDMKAMLEHSGSADRGEAAQVSEPLPRQEHLHFETDSGPRAEPEQ